MDQVFTKLKQHLWPASGSILHCRSWQCPETVLVCLSQALMSSNLRRRLACMMGCPSKVPVQSSPSLSIESIRATAPAQNIRESRTVNETYSGLIWSRDICPKPAMTIPRLSAESAHRQTLKAPLYTQP